MCKTKKMQGSPPFRAYRRSELEVFDLIKRPVSVLLCGEEWGDKKWLFWGNTACVSLWNANSRDELLARDFNKDMSDSVKQRNHDIARRCRAGERFSQQWTYYPGGVAQTMVVTFTEIWIDQETGRPPLPAVLADALSTQEIREQTNAEGLRSIEMLRHLPVAVALFAENGSVVLQNPIDNKLFQFQEGNNENDGKAINQTLSSDSTSPVSENDMPIEGSDFVRRFVDVDLGQRILTNVVEFGTVYNIEAEQITGTNSRAWFALQVQRSTDPVTGSKVLLYSARDITQIIQAKKQEQAAAVKNELLSCVAHEIRTPFHQVNGFNELLAQTELNSQQREYVQEIDAASRCMMSVLNDLLDFNKLDAGKLQIESIQFNVEDIVRGSLSAVQAGAEKKELELISMSLADSVPRKVVGDPNRLRQILLNFLNNAIKFTKEGQVVLDVAMVPNTEIYDSTLQLEFAVTDTGIGISKENQAAIFQKYVQATVEIARRFGGTGLGLAICQGLTKAMGGDIGVESELGRGSRFWVRLPFRLPRESQVFSEDDPIVAPVSESQFHVLVAEDNPMNQKLVKRMLERLGHEATLVNDGLQALRAIERTKFDLVLMDRTFAFSPNLCIRVSDTPVLAVTDHMPNMDGIEATQQIRGPMGISSADLPVLGLSADFRPAELDHYISNGMNSCIGKPVRMKLLQESILDVMESSRRPVNGDVPDT